MAPLYAQLLSQGYCIIDEEHPGLLRDASFSTSLWFQSSPRQKSAAVSSDQDVAAGTGRGYFILPAKEVVEVSNTWNCPGVRSDMQRAVKTAYNTLQRAANNVLGSILTLEYGFHMTPKYESEIMGPQLQFGDHQGFSGFSTSSVLHINNYRPNTIAAAEAAANGTATAVAQVPVAANEAAAAASSEHYHLLHGTEAHIDRGLLTVIYSTGPGLEVCGPDGCWVPVTPGPGQLVILVGHTLSHMTAGRLPAALHRVVVDPPPAAAAGGNWYDNSSSSNSGGRVSLCFKLRANPTALLSPARITGSDAALLPERYRCLLTTQQLMADFDATHVSINGPAGGMQQQQQHQQWVQAPAPAAHAEAMPVSAGRAVHLPAAVVGGYAEGAAKRPGCSSLQHFQKRQCLQANVYTVDSVEDMMQVDGLKSMTIHCQNSNREMVSFNTKCTTRFERVFHMYESLKGFRFRFLFDRLRLDPAWTPEDVNLVDGDVIDAVTEQCGD